MYITQLTLFNTLLEMCIKGILLGFYPEERDILERYLTLKHLKMRYSVNLIPIENK